MSPVTILTTCDMFPVPAPGSEDFIFSRHGICATLPQGHVLGRQLAIRVLATEDGTSDEHAPNR